MPNHEPGSFKENVVAGMQLFVTLVVCGSLIGIAAGWVIGNGRREALIVGALIGGGLLLIGMLASSLELVFLAIISLATNRQPAKLLSQYLGFFLAAAIAAALAWLFLPDLISATEQIGAKPCTSDQLLLEPRSEKCPDVD